MSTRTRSEGIDFARRRLLFRTLTGAGVLGLQSLTGFSLLGASAGCAIRADLHGLRPEPDENGLRLPPGFRSRVIATTGHPVANTQHIWHGAPDGGAVFPTEEGGWIYVSNSELPRGMGGVGAIRFDADAVVQSAYSILSGTSQNCAGGATPWKTWLSCEEVSEGEVYECDPYVAGGQGVVRPALGVFKHEAVAVDPDRRVLYMTEDEPDGLLYRFTPSSYPSLLSGRLEAMEILDTDRLGPIRPGEKRGVAWHPIEDPRALTERTRHQASAATPFRGGEGCSYASGLVYFATKIDNRVWKLDAANQMVEIVYDLETAAAPLLSGVDNVLARDSGEVYVAEDPGTMQIVRLSADGALRPMVQVTGQYGSEVTGPAFSPDGTRLYFSSQRIPGTTYEVTGKF